MARKLTSRSLVSAILIICLNLLTVLLSGAHAQPKLGSFEDRIAAASRQLQSSVLSVRSLASSGVFGSGIVVDAERRLVLTSAHVVAQSKELILRANNGLSFSGTPIFSDETLDLALLSLAGTDPLPAPVKFAPSTVPLGSIVLAGGSPGGYEFSVSLGMVSALDRKLPETGEGIPFIQVDANLQKGSSGGPVISLDGKLVGIVSRGGASGGPGFALPVAVVSSFIEHFERSKNQPKAALASLGFIVQQIDPALREFLGAPAETSVIISHVYHDSPEAVAGMRLGDVLISVDDSRVQPVGSDELLSWEGKVAASGPGVHRFRVWRAGNTIDIEVKLPSKSSCGRNKISTDISDFRSYSSNPCYLLPRGDFIEVYSHPPMPNQPSNLQRGDLLIWLDGNEDLLENRLISLLQSSAGRFRMAQVLRQGKPFLVTVPSSGKVITSSD